MHLNKIKQSSIPCTCTSTMKGVLCKPFILNGKVIYFFNLWLTLVSEKELESLDVTETRTISNNFFTIARGIYPTGQFLP